MSLEQKIIEKLKTIQDPEVRQDVYSLGLVFDIKVKEDEGYLSLKFRPTVFNCPIGIQLALMIKRGLLDVEGLKRVDMEVVDFIMAPMANEYLKALDEESSESNK